MVHERIGCRIQLELADGIVEFLPGLQIMAARKQRITRITVTVSCNKHHKKVVDDPTHASAFSLKSLIESRILGSGSETAFSAQY